MAYKDLNEYLRTLDKRGELIRIKSPVSPLLEITEITDRISKCHGKALLFENVEGSCFPVLMNAFGSYDRMSLSLGAEKLDDIANDISQYLDLGNYTSIRKLIRFAPKLLRLLCCLPLRRHVKIRRPACQQVIIRNPDLSILPVLKCWPEDGGRFITLPLVFTRYPGSGIQNAGMYRMQILDKDTTAMHWHKHKDGAGIYEAYQKLGGRMPVSVAIGCEPSITYSATAPLPPGLDEMMLAGFLRKRPVRMVKCVTNDIYVPEDTQFVLEGYVDTNEDCVLEGPFGDHTGYYSLADYYPRFHVTAITHRKDAVYPATVVGKPPMEDCYMAKATERIFLPVLKLSMPQLHNLNLPLEGVFHNCAVVSVRNSYPGAARTIMNQIWGMGQMRYTKLIITVDMDIDPCDTDRVIDAVLTHVDLDQDLVISKGPLDALDHSSDEALYGTRLGVDATRKARKTQIQPGTLSIVSIHKTAPWDGRRKALDALEHSDARITIVVDDYVDTGDRQAVMWRLFNNIDASRDLLISGGRAAIDATRKRTEEGLSRPWPEDIVMSEAVKDKVTGRWEEYGLAGIKGYDK